MKKPETLRRLCLLVSSIALVGLTACSDQQAGQTETSQSEATQSEAPAVTEQQETPTIDYSSEPTGAELAFMSLDTDQDQLISMEEAAANLGVSSEFAIIDLDKDDGINLDEFLVYAGEATAAGPESEMTEEKSTQ